MFYYRYLVLLLIILAQVACSIPDESSSGRASDSGISKFCNNLYLIANDNEKISYIENWSKEVLSLPSVISKFPSAGEIKAPSSLIEHLGIDWGYLGIDKNSATISIYPRNSDSLSIEDIELVSVGEGRNFITVSLKEHSEDVFSVIYPREGKEIKISDRISLRCFY